MSAFRPLLPEQLAVQRQLDTEALLPRDAQLRGDRYVEPTHHSAYQTCRSPERRRTQPWTR